MEGPRQRLLISSRSINKHGQMNRNFVASTYGRFCIKFHQSRMKGEPTEPLICLIKYENSYTW